jgi:4-hydroxybenzoate polyprenyltransferase
MLSRKNTINNENCQFVLCSRAITLNYYYFGAVPRSHFILAPEKGALNILLDFDLFYSFSLPLYRLLVTSSIISTIVKRLDQPSQQNHVRSIVSQNKIDCLLRLKFHSSYGIIHFMAGFPFFSLFVIWFYSHKIKKYPLVEI